MRGGVRPVKTILWLVVAAVVGGVAGAAVGEQTGTGTGPVEGAALGVVALVVLRSLFGGGKGRAVATIVRIWDQPPPGAPWYYWVYVLFESKGKRIKVRLTKAQARQFVDSYREGDTGHLEWSGKRLRSWRLASDREPAVSDTGVQVFLSYSREESEWATYIAQVLGTHGLRVWQDVQRLQTGDRLSDEITRQIRASKFFVPVLSPHYVVSPWCMKELELAASVGLPVLPVKVTAEPLAFAPHLQRLYQDTLGDPLYLDVARQDPAAKLKELAQQMIGQSGLDG